MINFEEKTIDYNNATIVAYPGGAGGKFLINCLSLNDRAVFQDGNLARKQLDNKFTVRDKINYLKKNLQDAKTEKVWNDLNLGHGQLCQLNALSYRFEFPQILCKKLNSGILLQCMQEKLHFFLDVHFLSDVQNLQKIWINSKVIIFTNYRNFIEQRKDQTDFRKEKHIQMIEYWKTVKGNSWPKMPPKNLREFKQLSQSIQNELTNDFYNQLFNFFDYSVEEDLLWSNSVNALLVSDNVCEFDVEYSYKNTTQFYESYKKICNFLQLPIQEKNIIDWYFDEWQDVIKIISDASPPFELE